MPAINSNYFPEPYHQTFTSWKRLEGVLLVTGMFATLALFALIITNQIGTLASGRVSLPLKQVLIGEGVTVTLGGGAAFLINRLKKADDFGTLGSDGLREAYLEDDRYIWKSYVDTSTLDANGNGKADIYGVKSWRDHYVVSALVMLSTPLYTVAKMVYHIFRLIITPFYIGTCMLVETVRGEPLFKNGKKKDRKFKLSDIPNQMVYSIRKIVTAPFYGTALFIAAFWSLIDPIGGRKLGTRVERSWNDGLTRAQSFWSVQGPQKLFHWPLPQGPSKLGQEGGFYLAGCWAPIGTAHFQNGAIVRGESLSRYSNYTVTLKE